VTAPDSPAPALTLERGPTRFSLLALASFLLGIASTGLLAGTGIPALICGYCALFRINSSEGRLRGRILAIVGMIWGGLTTLITIALFILLVSLHLNAKSNQAVCANNLRQIGAALQQYQDNNGHAFPAGTRRGAALPVDQRLSWMTTILPFLDNRPNHPSPWQSTANNFDPDQAWDTGKNVDLTRPFLSRYICPSWENMPVNVSAGLTSYVGLAGVGPDAPQLPLGDPNTGFFGYDRFTSMADLRLKGGAAETEPEGPTGSSYILVATETTISNGPWGQGGPSTCRGLAPLDGPPLGKGCPFGGLHKGGANALRGDGAVHFEDEGIDPALFQTLLRLSPSER
jgi:hypothetical protein